MQLAKKDLHCRETNLLIALGSPHMLPEALMTPVLESRGIIGARFVEAMLGWRRWARAFCCLVANGMAEAPEAKTTIAPRILGSESFMI